MSNTVTLAFAGDAQDLQRAARQAQQATTGVADTATAANADFAQAARGSQTFTDRIGKLGAAVDGASTAIGDAAGMAQALADVQAYGYEKAQRLARATNDMAQAQVDANQAMLDGKQATLDIGQAQIDAEQAVIDAAEAQKAYNEAVAEHGAGSTEAKQAALDLKQAQQDLKQANYDVEQAHADAAQATVDLKDAQLNLNDAAREANPPALQEWADKLNLVAPLLSGLVGVVALVTAAQWAWNVAQLASPTTWIILAVVALIAVIVLIATKTTWFQDLWRVTWEAVKGAALAVWAWMKDTLWPGVQKVFHAVVEGFTSIPTRIRSAFTTVFDIVTAPFRLAFNFVARAWNNTVGALRWSVPSWVPGIGGNTIAAPHLPTFHRGGIVPGGLGAETLAVLQAGERVTAPGGTSAPTVLEIRSDGSALADLLVEVLSTAVRARGGDVQTVLGSA